MAELLTADKAREMMQRANPDWHVGEILKDVEKAASAGQDYLKTYACDFGSGNLYSGKPTELQQAVMDKLRALGFSVGVRVQERQFVDIWLEVSWKGKD